MSSMLWTAFEVMINIYQGFIVTYFTHYFLRPKRNKPFFRSSGLLWALALSAVFTIANHITIYESLAIFIYVVILLIYSLIALQGTILQKLFVSLVPFEIISIVSIFFINLFAAFFDVPLSEIMRNKSLSRFVLLVVVQLVVLWLFFLTSKHLQKDKCKLQKEEWQLIFAVLVISVFITAFLNHISLFEQVNVMKILIALSVMGLALINVVVYYMIVGLSEKNSVISENIVLKIKKNFEKDYLSKILKENEAAKKIRHDYKGNFTVLQMLITENKLDAALKHINKNITAINKLQSVITTSNDVVNAVLNLNIGKAKELGINVSVCTVPSFDGVDDIDLCNLLENLLQNAIASCEKCNIDKRLIEINIIDEKTKYVFSIKNSAFSSVLEGNPGLATTKVDKELHGLGIKIIKDIAEKYDGRCDFYEEDQLFCCSVILRKIL